MMRSLLCAAVVACLGSSLLAQGWVQPYADTPSYWENIESQPQLNAAPAPDTKQVTAFAWVRERTPIGEPAVIAASISWLFNDQGNAQQRIVVGLTALRYSGYDAQGLNLESHENHVRIERGGHTLDDCFIAVSGRLVYVLTARIQALQRCHEDGAGVWTPAWKPWQPVRLPNPANHSVLLPTGGRLPLRFNIRDGDLMTTVAR